MRRIFEQPVANPSCALPFRHRSARSRTAFLFAGTGMRFERSSAAIPPGRPLHEGKAGLRGVKERAALAAPELGGPRGMTPMFARDEGVRREREHQGPHGQLPLQLALRRGGLGILEAFPGLLAEGRDELRLGGSVPPPQIANGHQRHLATIIPRRDMFTAPRIPGSAT